jgi:hypothetical protein
MQNNSVKPTSIFQSHQFTHVTRDMLRYKLLQDKVPDKGVATKSKGQSIART